MTWGMSMHRHIVNMDAKKRKVLCIAAVLVVKVILGGMFSSDFQNEMFIPFTKTFLTGLNPYTYFYENGLKQSFPYLPFMLFIESVGGLAVQAFGKSVFIQNLFFKLPLFAFDILTYHTLRKMEIRFKYAFVLYFCSPVILYGTFMHGQLDVIPTSLLTVAVYHLANWREKNHLLKFSFFLGLSLSTKFHIIACVPILFLYLAKKRDYKETVRWLVLAAFIPLVFVIPFWGEGFLHTVFLNQEQKVLFQVGIEYGKIILLLPILAVMLIYLKAFELEYFNKDLLYSLTGVLFAVFLVCVPSAPAWYTWIVPFIVLYFGYADKGRYKVLFLYAGFNFMYLVYFVFLYQTDNTDLYFLGHSLQNWKFGDLSVQSVGFTVMVAVLGAVIYDIFRFGIASNNLYRRGDIPFTIGIAGDSSTGKSRMLGKVRDLVSRDQDILFIEGDGDHRWERGDENWSAITALDPKANYLYKQANDISALRKRNHVDRHDYDHELGIFTPKSRISPKRYIVISGLHVLFLPQLRREIDLKIYMKAEENLQKLWKIKRDVTDRHYKVENVVNEMNRRLEDAEKYIFPQEQYADIVITFYDETLKDYTDLNHAEEVSVKVKTSVEVNLEGIVHDLRTCGMWISHSICSDFAWQEIDIKGADIDSLDIDYDEIAADNVAQYVDYFSYTPKWQGGIEAVIQLILLVMISGKMQGEI